MQARRPSSGSHSPCSFSPSKSFIGQHVHATSRIYVPRAFPDQPVRCNTNRTLYLWVTRGSTRRLRGTDCPGYRTKRALSAGFVLYPSCYPGTSTTRPRCITRTPSRGTCACGGAARYGRTNCPASRSYLRLVLRRWPWRRAPNYTPTWSCAYHAVVTSTT